MISCRCQPDSGNPTVRDEKRAEQKRESRGTVNPPHKPKGCVTETLLLKLNALFFYSTIEEWPWTVDCGLKENDKCFATLYAASSR